MQSMQQASRWPTGGEWINKKWKVRRGFIKMHALADTDTGLILSLKITDGSVGDSKTFVPLLNQAEPDTAGSGQQNAAKGADAEAAAVIEMPLGTRTAHMHHKISTNSARTAASRPTHPA